MATDRVVSEVQGVVSCVSGTGSGLKLVGGDAWVNASKFASVTMPPVGASVVLGLDKAGYIREITTAEPNRSDNPEGCTSQAPPADRETRISRLACLNTATAILTTHNARGGVPVDDVLTLAGRLEAWVTR